LSHHRPPGRTRRIATLGVGLPNPGPDRFGSPESRSDAPIRPHTPPVAPKPAASAEARPWCFDQEAAARAPRSVCGQRCAPPTWCRPERDGPRASGASVDGSRIAMIRWTRSPAPTPISAKPAPSPLPPDDRTSAQSRAARAAKSAPPAALPSHGRVPRCRGTRTLRAQVAQTSSVQVLLHRVGGGDQPFLDAERPAFPQSWPDIMRVLNLGGLLVVDNVISRADHLREFRAQIQQTPGVTEALTPTGAGALLVVRDPSPGA